MLSSSLAATTISTILLWMFSAIKGIVDSVSNLFSSDVAPPATSSSPAGCPSPAPAVVARREMAGTDVVSGRVALRLQGYFDLAVDIIDKAARAEQRGAVVDAVADYRRARQVLLEAKGITAPASISSREKDKVMLQQDKISKWLEKVSERLKVLDPQTVGTSKAKTGSSNSRSRVASSPANNLKNIVPGKPINSRINNGTVGNASNDNRVLKSPQETGNAYDPKLLEMINSVIVDRSPSVKWDDVAGLDKAKQALLEMVILPTKRRDLFTGLRKPARGLLLFGPPGTGKTMLAKAVASESNATFFNVSASSLTSKWVGEAEKLVKTLFFVAASRQPSVIFMDEIDSIMSTRMANENDASRRLKSEFLVQFDGVTSSTKDLVIVIGATNKPQELDDAVLRRLVKKIYVPLPDENVRRLLLRNQLKGQAFSLPDSDLKKLVKDTEGYSGSDLQALCEEAAMMPIRELGTNILTVKENQVRPLNLNDFRQAMTVIRPSIVKSKWEELEMWNKEFGSS